MKNKTEAKRQAILDEATQAFRELGYERTSMAEICARVGGSKATIYNYFSSKEELFFEVMLRSTEAEFAAAHRAINLMSDDLAVSLRQFGEHFLAFLYSPEVQAHRHLAIVQSRHTDLGRLLYQRGVMRSQALVAEFFQAAMAAGKLRQFDPHIAAKHFYSLLESELIDRFLFQLPGEVGQEEIKRVTARAVAVFMAAYGPECVKVS